MAGASNRQNPQDPYQVANKVHAVITVPTATTTEISHPAGAFGHLIMTEGGLTAFSIGSDAAQVTAGHGITVAAGVAYGEAEAVQGPWYVRQTSGSDVDFVHVYNVADGQNG